MPTPGKKWTITIGLALIASLLAPLFAWGYICCFTRYWYDDFCYAAVVNRLGFLKSLPYEYKHWTGRYTLLLFNAVLAQIGPKTATIISLLLLFAWVCAATWAIHQLFFIMRLPSALIASFLLATLIIFATLNSAPDIVASFYWQTGGLVYTMPLVLMMVHVGLILSVVRKKLNPGIASPWVVASAVVAFVAGGCSETYGAVQIAALSFVILISLKLVSRPNRRALLLMSAAGLLGALLSLGILAVAPGNDVRRGFFPPHPHLPQVIEASLSYSLSFVERHTRRSRGTTLLTLVAPLWLAFNLVSCRPDEAGSRLTAVANRKRTLALLAISPIAVLALLTASVAPGYYVLAEAPPGRVLFIPKFVLIVFAVIWVFIGSQYSAKLLRNLPRARTVVSLLSTLAVLVLAIVSPLASARRTFSLGGKAAAAAAQWDNTNRAIQRSKNEGANNLVLPAINANESQLGFGRTDLLPGPDPNAATNRCLADYYELDAITFK